MTRRANVGQPPRPNVGQAPRSNVGQAPRSNVGQPPRLPRGGRSRATPLERLLPALLLALAIVPGLVAAASWERPILPGAPGHNLLPLDAQAVVGARPGHPDLRIFGADGAEVEYLLVEPAGEEPRWSRGVLRRIAETKESSGVEVELPRAEIVDAVRIGGIATPYLKRVRLEGSGDRSRWTVLAEETTIFDLPDRGLRRDRVEFPAGELRYFRITFDDRSSARARPSHVEVREAGVGAAPPPSISLEHERRADEPRVTRFRIRLPERGFPLTAVVPRIERGNVFREATVTEMRMGKDGLDPVILGRATLRRAEIEGEVASDLRIPISAPETAEIELALQRGDGLPLPISGIDGEIAAQPAIVFESSDAAPLTARWGGRRLEPPRYDIEALRPRIDGLSLARARWGEPRLLDGKPSKDAELGESIPRGAKVDTSAYRWTRDIRVPGSGLLAVPLDAAALAHGRPGEDFRIVDSSGRQVPYLLERRGEQLVLPLAIRTIAESPAGVSRYEVQLPFDALPAASLVLRTPSRLFRREVRLLATPGEARGEAREISRSSWAHADSASEAPPFVLALPARAERTYLIEIDEGDNEALPLRRPELLVPSWRLRFVLGEENELQLVYGNPEASAPRYDLELLASRLLAAPADEAALGVEREAGGVQSRFAPSFFWIAVAVAAFALLALTAKLAR